jgi:hypothetical protein
MEQHVRLLVVVAHMGELALPNDEKVSLAKRLTPPIDKLIARTDHFRNPEVSARKSHEEIGQTSYMLL